MDREDFMDIVYSELESDSDNNRANRIIDAADEYVENTQLGTNLAEVVTDCISRQAAIDVVTDELDMIDHVPQWVFDRLEKRLKQLPPVQPKPCNYINACNELAMNNISSAYGYLQVLKEFEKYGYVLVDTMGNIR